jgi:hypothetical protein
LTEYRVIPDVNTKVRRLGYFVPLLQMVGQRNLGPEVLLPRFVAWGKEHQHFLKDYLDPTGDIVPEKSRGTRSQRRGPQYYAARRYLEFAESIGWLTRISNAYAVARFGAILLNLARTLPRQSPNPFWLSEWERSFFLYELLRKDADFLLTIASLLETEHSVALKYLQRRFQDAHLARLEARIGAAAEEHVQRLLLQRRLEIQTKWKGAARYAEHIVPPRLHWLLDMGLLEPDPVQSDEFQLNSQGQRLFCELPPLPGTDVLQITAEWLESRFFGHAMPLLITSRPKFRVWMECSEREQNELATHHLTTAFRMFQRGSVPKISLTQGLLFTCISLAVVDGVLTELRDLTAWLRQPQYCEGQRMEIRVSARENESYIVLNPI